MAHALAPLAIAQRLEDDHCPDQSREEREDRQGRNVEGEGDEREQEEREDEPAAIQGVDMSPAEGDEPEEVDRDAAEQGECRNLLERVPGIPERLLQPQ